MNFFIVCLVVGVVVFLTTVTVSVARRRLSFSLISAISFALSMTCLGLLDIVHQVDKPACAFGFVIFGLFAATTVGLVPAKKMRNSVERSEMVQ